MQETGIFLSYRREDSAGYVRLLYDRLSARFPDSIFLDVGIEAGQDFVKAIENAVASSAVLLAIIGRSWLTASRDGQPRLYNPEDFVRLEIASALARNTSVIPVVLPGATLPRPEELPDVLRPLVRRQAFCFTEAGFDYEIAQFIRVLEQELGPLAQPPVIVSGMMHNQGWTLQFNLVDRHVREILYRFEGEPEFRSTGLQRGTRDTVTGLPVPRPSAEAGHLRSSLAIEVKYIDAGGNECGPYRLIFDVEKELVAATKEILDLAPEWVAFREYPEGTLNAYFTPLLCYKNAFREIRYSVNDESLSQKLAFEPDREAPGVPGIGPRDQAFLQIPISSGFVSVKLLYIDGTESPIRKFLTGELRRQSG